MTRVTADVDDFYGRRVPAQWNRTLDAQQALAEEDASARSMFDEMRRVNATIEVLVSSEGQAPDEGADKGADFEAGEAMPRRYVLNVADGRMACGGPAQRAPFLVLSHDLETFATLERESGDSVLGFLGTLAGQPGDMKLTSTRLQNLLGLRGRARLELTGGAPMTLAARFGAQARDEPEPSCTLRVASEAFAALRVGDLAPQDAFMNGQVDVEGDMQLAMQLALAALSPD